MALSMATRKLADDWAVQHAYRPVLVETFVDLTRFKATLLTGVVRWDPTAMTPPAHPAKHACLSFEYAVDRTVHLSVGLLKGQAGLRDYPCRTDPQQIALPKATPVSAAAMCKARARVPRLHAAILKHTVCYGPAMAWAQDFCSSKLNLPRPLINSGYRIPSDNAGTHRLYQMRSKLPIDFDLCAHQNERTAALAHVHALSKNDVVVYDRGYYSYEMLHEHARRGLHPIFRIKNKANPTFDKFISEAQTDAIVEVTPGQKSQQKLHPAICAHRTLCGWSVYGLGHHLREPRCLGKIWY